MHPIKFPVIKLLVLSLESRQENPTWSSESKDGNEATESEGREGGETGSNLTPSMYYSALKGLNGFVA